MMPTNFPPAGADPNDTRFQFEVIKNLADSVRQLAAGMADMQKSQVGILERLAKIEANRVNEDVAHLRARVDGVFDKVDLLERDRDRRDGANGVLAKIWANKTFVLVAAIFIIAIGRQVGVIKYPEQPPAIVQRAEHAFERPRDGEPKP